MDAYNRNISTLIYDFTTGAMVSYNLFDRGAHEIAVGHLLVTDGKAFYSLKYLYEMPEQLKKRFWETNKALILSSLNTNTEYSAFGMLQ